MELNEIILKKKVTKFHNKQLKTYYYFRYDSVPKCIILSKGGSRVARKLAHDWYKELEEEENCHP